MITKFNTDEFGIFEELENTAYDAVVNYFEELGNADGTLADQFWLRVWEKANSVYIAANGTHGSPKGLAIVPADYSQRPED
jgi:hypothetical protein